MAAETSGKTLSWDDMTYLQFHLLFILPPVLVLAWTLPGSLGSVGRRAGLGLALIPLVAFAYTTPWDIYLIRTGVWGYGEARVVGSVGGVPLEEYLFFLLQPLLTGLWLYRLILRDGLPPRGPRNLSPRLAGALFWLAMGCVGAFSLRWDGGRYLGLILVWACPVLALQWAYGGDFVWRSGRTWLLGAAVPTLYLWLADRLAIGRGIWDVSREHTTGLAPLGLPVEEALFFAITNLMVVGGLLCFLLLTGPPPSGPRPVRGTQDRSPSARRTLVRSLLWPSWGVLTVAAVACAVGPAPPERLQYLPLLASVVLLGLPHGALDLLVVPRLRGRPAGMGLLLGVAALYLALAGAYLAAWWAAPAAAFVLFVVLTWFHWGQGDLYSLLGLTGAHLDGRLGRVLTLVARGGIPMVVPLLAFPETYREVAQSLVGLFEPGAVARISWAFEPTFRLAAGIGLAAVVAASLFVGRERSSPGTRRAWRAGAAETLLLVAYFALVPPLLAIGLYFCLWHSLRHVARLMLLDRGSSLGRGRLVPALGRFARDAAPLTLAALLLLVGLYLAVAEPEEGWAALLGTYLVLISVLTLPHTAVVCWMDYRQGVWRGDGSQPLLGPRRDAAPSTRRLAPATLGRDLSDAERPRRTPQEPTP